MMHIEKFNTEQQLRDIYYEPVRGFQSKEKLYQKAKEQGRTVSRKPVGEWLKSQDVYTQYKPIVRKLDGPRQYAKYSTKSMTAAVRKLLR